MFFFTENHQQLFIDIAIIIIPLNLQATQTISGKDTVTFETELKNLLRQEGRYASVMDRGIMPEGYLEAPLAYDAVWAVALGKQQLLIDKAHVTISSCTVNLN